MMLDAIAATRQAVGKQQPQQAQQGEAVGATAVPAMSSDRAAEAALACMLCLLRRCACQAGDSLLGLLRRLAAILELPAGAASEEIRQQALLCLGAAAAGAVNLQPSPGVREALLDEAAAPLLGYLSSLLLQVRLGGGVAAERASVGLGSCSKVAPPDSVLHFLLAGCGGRGAAGQQRQQGHPRCRAAGPAAAAGGGSGRGGRAAAMQLCRGTAGG